VRSLPDPAQYRKRLQQPHAHLVDAAGEEGDAGEHQERAHRLLDAVQIILKARQKRRERLDRTAAERDEHGRKAEHEQRGGKHGLAPHPAFRLGVLEALQRGAGEEHQIGRHQRQDARRQEADQPGDQGRDDGHIAVHGALDAPATMAVASRPAGVCPCSWPEFMHTIGQLGSRTGATTVDAVIVGSGLTGSVIGRTLHDAGLTVSILERRSHLGGNVHDYTHDCGVRVHSYGPHYFRTNSPRIWSFVNRFARFRRFEARLKTDVDGRLENWPIAASAIRRIAGENWKPEFSGIPANFEQACLAKMPRIIYEKFVLRYTEKQWGVPAWTLAASLAHRFDVRDDDETRLSRHAYQGIPEAGYAAFIHELVRGIPVILNHDYLKHRKLWARSKKTVFTGPIDEFFGFDLGKLKYRAQQRENEYVQVASFAQPCVQVNNPTRAGGHHIRTIEWKHLATEHENRLVKGTLLTRETAYSPDNPDEYEYPFPDADTAALYSKYAKRARNIPNLLICGRLGEYTYYDMDQAIARAALLAQRVINEIQGETRDRGADHLHPI
jgi:UDP-galactopyranose mutase